MIMSQKTNLRKGDEIKICGEKYRLIKNFPLKGFQFRTWLVESVSNGKKRIAKITYEKNKALSELRVYIYLTGLYPKRYYARMLAFDHQAQLIRNNFYKNKRFCAIILEYLPEDRFQSLDEYLKDNLSQGGKRKLKKKLAYKIERRIQKLHELCIAHGDIREANIMIDAKKSGRIGVRIIDFGLSKFGDEEAKNKDKVKVKILCDCGLKPAEFWLYEAR